MGRKLKITEKQLEFILENISVFSDCNGVRLKRYDIVTTKDGSRWRVLMFMDGGEVKCVGLDESNNDDIKYFKTSDLNCKPDIDETTTTASVGGKYDVPLFGKIKK
jgi:hypothetical protein